MASATRYFCRSLAQVTRHVPVKRRCLDTPFQSHTSVSIRQFSCTSRHRAAEESNGTAEPGPPTAPSTGSHQARSVNPDEFLVPDTPLTVHDFDPETRADYEALSKSKQAEFLAHQNHLKAVTEGAASDEELEELANRVGHELQRVGDGLEIETGRSKPHELGFWGMDEVDEFSAVEDGDDEVTPDLITSVAHSEMELHREIREYTRVAAWEMPLLKQFAKPFQLPDQSTPLRFRYTTYMGEHHPAAKKVVVEFCTKELPGLTEQQRIKFVKLVGVRYNPDTDVVRMSSEKYENPAQNKRYLGDLINALVNESKTGDMFEDIPLDFRHHKPKKYVKYPEEWKMTPKTIQRLLEKREQAQLLLEATHEAVDGKEMVHEYIYARGRSSGAVSQQQQLRQR